MDGARDGKYCAISVGEGYEAGHDPKVDDLGNPCDYNGPARRMLLTVDREAAYDLAVALLTAAREDDTVQIELGVGWIFLSDEPPE
jgi:hypothetical protein